VRRRRSAGLGEEAVAVEEGVDDGEELTAVAGGKALDLLEAAPEALVAGLGDGLLGLEAEELVGGDAEDVGEEREQVCGRPIGLALVVGDHALGDADLLAELALAEACAQAEASEAEAEGLVVRG